MKRKNSYDKSVYRSLALISQFSINMLVPICLMTALGIFLDSKLGTSYWVVVLFFVGAIAGGQNIYRMAKGIYNRTDAGRERNKQDSADGGNIKEDK